MSLIILCAAALACLMLTLLVYDKYWKYGLNVSVAFAKRQIEEGQHVILQEKVENRKILPLLTLTVKFQMDREMQYVETENTNRTDMQYRNDCIPVMPYQRVTRSLELVGTARGFYSVDKINVVASDLFFQRRYIREYENQTWLYVYPARSRLKRLPEVFRRMYGEYLTNRLVQEDPFEFKGIRDYTPADPMRKVNWKSSAKTGSLKVNQFYDTAKYHLTIFLNVEQRGILKRWDLIEESIRMTRNFVEDFVKKGVPVMVISNGCDQLTHQEIFIGEGAGDGHISVCLKQLARLKISEDVREMAKVIREQKDKGRADSVTILISAEENEALAAAYQEYAKEAGGAGWMIPVHEDMRKDSREKMKTYGNIHTEYLVMEQMV